MSEALPLAFQPTARTVKARFDEFIQWAEPGGTAGFDQLHVKRYARPDPFFSFSARLLPHSHNNRRVWFIRREYLKRSAAGGLFKRARGDSVPEITNRFAMIRPGRFLSFAKAYLNVYCVVRGVRSVPNPTVKALIFLEKAIRDVNDGSNDPSHMSHVAFHRAALAVQRSGMASGTCYDIGKALEHIALLVQSGGRFKGDKRSPTLPGFRLLNVSFAFRSPIKAPPKFGRRHRVIESPRDSGNLTSEEVAAVGLAYRRALERFGHDATPTFFAALMGLSLTTASMRPSELQSLRFDALYSKNERQRLRIPRPKIGIEQDVPVSKRLGSLASDIFEEVRRHSVEARAAFAFYIKRSPEGLSGIHTLYVPSNIKPLLKYEYLTKKQAHAIINPDVKTIWFPQRLSGVIRITHFVEKPGDVYGPARAWPMVKIRDVLSACERLPCTITLPVDVDTNKYILRSTALRLMKSGRSSEAVLKTLHILFSSSKAKACEAYMPRDAVLDYLLAQFRKSRFPHWPYTSKDRSVRLDEALAVHFEAGDNAHIQAGTQRQQWWLPRLLSIQTLNTWVSGSKRHSPLLFSLTDVKLHNGRFPKVSVQKTRRYHHTAALLAGANPLFANELAGRQSGWQAEFYDRRTPREIVLGSIDTYDPDQGSDAIGPIADLAPSPRRVVARKVFLMENVAPKNVTEIGGCRSDWTLNPCDFLGDCIRCGELVWRKGDIARLPAIHDLRLDAMRTIKLGMTKLRRNPRMKSIERQVLQKMESLERYDFILGIEADDTVEIGTLVTFSPARTVMSASELRSKLRKAAQL